MKVAQDFRVVVSVDDRALFEHDPHKRTAALRRRAETVRANIKRHVDDISDTDIIWDTVCEHCSAPWEDPPNCCNTACAEYDAREAK